MAALSRQLDNAFLVLGGYGPASQFQLATETEEPWSQVGAGIQPIVISVKRDKMLIQLCETLAEVERLIMPNQLSYVANIERLV